jgi:hypothetical protein
MSTEVVTQTASLASSDWVLICTTLFLGAVALFVPYLAEKLKRSYLAPKLDIKFDLNPPDCHLTRSKGHDSLGNKIDEPHYYFRFRVKNIGHSQARRCEAVIEDLFIADTSGEFKKLPLTPVNLIWGSGYATEFVDINPDRRFFCDFCNIPSQMLQALELPTGKYVNPLDNEEFDLGLILNVKTAFHSQPNRLPAGKYRISVAIYSENTKTIRTIFEISWTGIWKNNEDAMFREAVIRVLNG